MKNIALLTSQHCSGCGACAQKCPLRAIAMKPDEEGFEFPAVNSDLCTDCGLCLAHCPGWNDNMQALFYREAPEVYAAHSKELPVLLQSASGGIGYELGKLMLRQGGVVYGCAWRGEGDFKAVHIRVSDENELPRLCQSKYVQSDCSPAYPQVLQDLKDGKKVLFTGTPCQIAGLRTFLRRDYDNLLTVDLICHGVPSHKIFSAYLEYLERKEGSKITRFTFRAKQKAGYRTMISYRTAAGKERQTLLGFDPFYIGFTKSWLHRRSCLTCRFAAPARVADITIGDYWGFEKWHSEHWDKLKYGVSLCLFNTAKGRAYVEQLSPTVEMLPSRLEYAQRHNPALHHPFNQSPPEREVIYRKLNESGFQHLAETMLRPRRSRLHLLLPPAVKNFLKKWKNKLEVKYNVH